MTNQMHSLPNLAAKKTPAAALAWALAAACLAGALGMALHHPQSPVLCLALVWLWCCLAVWRPKAWLWLVPACLPWMNFSPWTGWVVFEEFDMLLLGTLASGYARLAWVGRAPGCQRLSGLVRGLCVAVAASTLVSMAIGVWDADSTGFDWFAGYDHALNAWRVGKSAIFALLFVPLLHRHLARVDGGGYARLAWGMVVGLIVALAAILWERAAFPGIFDFSAHYRTVALFWEMHVGGAALDVYLAVSVPFVVWALATVRHRAAWFGLAWLAVVLVYAGLTTFSRGVYLAMTLPAVLLVAWLWRRRRVAAGERVRWRFKASEVLLVVLTIEVVAVLVGGSFMAERLARAEQDMSSRMEHWRNGWGLLQTPMQWWLGRGIGRLPPSYAAEVPGGEFSGRVRWYPASSGDRENDAYISIYEPESNEAIAGLYALIQRVEPTLYGQYSVQMRVRASAVTRLEVYWCERHLLYDRSCQAAWVKVLPQFEDGRAVWQTLRQQLRGPSFGPAPWYAPRLKMFSVGVSDAGGVVELDSVALLAPDGRDLLRNGSFSEGTAHWLGAAQSYFEPWHLDNLALELLVERGWFGLLGMLALYVCAGWYALWGPVRQGGLVPYLAAALLAVALVGLVSSVMDVPRIAFLVYLMLWALMVGGQQGGQSMVDCVAQPMTDRRRGP